MVPKDIFFSNIPCLLSSETIQLKFRTSQGTKVSRCRALGVLAMDSCLALEYRSKFSPGHKPACAFGPVGQLSGPYVVTSSATSLLA